jgi:hypothetical protein
MVRKPVTILTVAFAVTIAIAVALFVPSLRAASALHLAASHSSATMPSSSTYRPGSEADQQLPILVRKPVVLASTDSALDPKGGGFHGFCACSCTHIPDCNTSADCGGAACLRAITCCEKPGKSSNLLAQSRMCNSKKSWKLDELD